MNLFYLGAFNFILFINLITYILFFFIIIGTVLTGLKRGLIRSSIRLGTIIAFTIIAGLITIPITNAILNIDVSSLNVEYNGAIATNLSEVVKAFLFQINGIESAANASPALMQLIENLPSVIISFVVFTILSLVFLLISWLVYYIIQRYALRSSKIEREIKKQQKLAKKSKQQGVVTQNQVMLTKPKRNRFLGALVGLVQGVVLAFILFFPVSTICNIVGDLTTTEKNVVEAEQTSENLNQKSADLIRYYVGDSTLQYFDAYNNTFVSEFVSMGGLNYAVFDEVTKINIENKDIKIRNEIFSLTKTYDDLMDILNIKQNTWKDLEINKINKLIINFLNNDLVSTLVPELMPYALENYVCTSNLFLNLPNNENIKLEINNLMADFKENDFIKSLCGEITEITNLAGNVFSSGLVDDIYADKLTGTEIKNYLTNNNNENLKLLLNSIYNSKIIKIAGTIGINFGIDKINTKLNLEKPLKEFNFSVFSIEEKKSFENIVLSIIDGYDFISNLSSFDIQNMTDKQLNSISDLLIALQNNTFKIYNENNELLDRQNTVLNKTGQYVQNGGPLSNVYISLVDHFVKKYIENIAYQNANWKEILPAVKAVSTMQSGELPKLEDIMSIIGLDENLGENAKEIASSINEITSSENVSQEQVADLLNNIASSVDKIDEEQFNELVDKVGQTIGNTDLANKVNYETIVEEKNVATTLADLLTNEEGLTESNADEVLNTLSSSEHIVKQVAKSGITIESNVADLEEKINTLSADEATKEELKTIFGINVG